MRPANQRKKERERSFLEAFIRIAGLDAKLLEEREAFDFLLEVEGRPVGLEVTEVFRQNDGDAMPSKVGEAIVDDIAARARGRYEEKGGKPLHVSLGFSTNSEMRHLNRRDAAEAIANFLLALDPPIGDVVKWKRSAPRQEPLPEPLTFMHVLAVSSPSAAHWSTPRAGWVAPLISSFLQPDVDEKARKLPQYREVVDEVWLLLAIEGRAPSQLFEPSNEIPTVVSPFDRTYLLSLFTGTAQLLPRPAE